MSAAWLSPLARVSLSQLLQHLDWDHICSGCVAPLAAKCMPLHHLSMLALPSTKLDIPACWSVTSVQESAPFLCTKQMPWFHSKEGKMATAVRGCRGKSWQHETTRWGKCCASHCFMHLSWDSLVQSVYLLLRCLTIVCQDDPAVASSTRCWWYQTMETLVMCS